MPEPTQTEVRAIRGRELKIHWNSKRLGEWLAWCYVPGPNNLPNEGVGFEARAATAEAARKALLEKVESHLARSGCAAGTNEEDDCPFTEPPSAASTGRGSPS
jgi:hypothetical protein